MAVSFGEPVTALTEMLEDKAIKINTLVKSGMTISCSGDMPHQTAGAGTVDKSIELKKPVSNSCTMTSKGGDAPVETSSSVKTSDVPVKTSSDTLMKILEAPLAALNDDANLANLAVFLQTDNNSSEAEHDHQIMVRREISCGVPMIQETKNHATHMIETQREFLHSNLGSICGATSIVNTTKMLKLKEPCCTLMFLALLLSVVGSTDAQSTSLTQVCPDCAAVFSARCTAASLQACRCENGAWGGRTDLGPFGDCQSGNNENRCSMDQLETAGNPCMAALAALSGSPWANCVPDTGFGWDCGTSSVAANECQPDHDCAKTVAEIEERRVTYEAWLANNIVAGWLVQEPTNGPDPGASPWIYCRVGNDNPNNAQGGCQTPSANSPHEMMSGAPSLIGPEWIVVDTAVSDWRLKITNAPKSAVSFATVHNGWGQRRGSQPYGRLFPAAPFQLPRPVVPALRTGTGAQPKAHQSSTLVAGASGPLVDLDGDGDLDYIGPTHWLENNGGTSGGFWTPHGEQNLMSEQHLWPWGNNVQNFIYASVTADLDGDGHKDVISLAEDSIMWFRNLGQATAFSDPSFLAERPLGGAHIYHKSPFFVTTGDFDLDGDMDILTVSKNSDGQLHPERYQAGDRRAYAQQLSGCTGGSHPMSYEGCSHIEWWENLDGQGTFANSAVWIEPVKLNAFFTKPHKIMQTDQVRGPSEDTGGYDLLKQATHPPIQLADMDTDGDLDILYASDATMTNGHGGEAVWIENTGGFVFGARHDVYAAGVGQTWASSSCSGNCGSGGNRKPGSGNALTAADLDGDGDIDVVAFPGATYRTQHGHISPNSAQDHGQPLPAVFINVNGDGIAWTGWMLPLGSLPDIQQYRRAMANDFDGDGDADIIIQSPIDNYNRLPPLVLVSRGAQGDSAPFTTPPVRLSESSWAGTDVLFGDIDEDGDDDIFFPSWKYHWNMFAGGTRRLTWIENDLACEPGYVSPTGRSPCTACTAPNISNTAPRVGGTACVSCIPGTTNADNLTSTACVECPSGRFSVVVGAEGAVELVCTACSPGSFSSSGATNCTLCAPGLSDFDQDAATPCESCTPGRSAGVGTPGACPECTAGYYAEGTGSPQCTPCLPGTALALAGYHLASGCQVCLAGSYAPAGSSSCHPCVEGTADTDSNAGTPCFACPTGSYSTGGTATSCTVCATPVYDHDEDSATPCITVGGNVTCQQSCAAGFEDHDCSSSTPCTSCLPGFYSIGGAFPAAMCSHCNPGQWAPAESTACTDCPNGQFDHDLSASTDCHYCQPGKVAASTTECANCRAGLYGLDGGGCLNCSMLGSALFSYAGSSSCTTCQPGKHPNADRSGCDLCITVGDSFFFSPDGGTCRRCINGTQPNAPRQGCIACVGSYSPDGRECVSCQAGSGPSSDFSQCEACTGIMYSNVGVCEVCVPPSEVSTDRQSCAVPYNCAAGKFCPMGACMSDLDCESCAPGLVSSGRGGCLSCNETGKVANPEQTACEQCAGGKEPAHNRTMCVACADSTYSTFGISCQSCGGTNIVDDAHVFCQTCDPGTAPSPDRRSCIPCVGHTSSAFGVCQACPADSISTVNHVSCQPCPAGMSPSPLGDACICSDGYYGSAEGLITCYGPSESFSVADSNTTLPQCSECPLGGCVECTGGIRTVPGFAISSALTAEGMSLEAVHAPRHVFQCRDMELCTGNISAPCTEGYDGPLCSYCAEDYSRPGLGGACGKCNSPLGLGIIAGFTAVSLVAVTVVLWVVSAGHGEGHGVIGVFMALGKIAISLVQVISQLEVVFDFKFPWSFKRYLLYLPSIDLLGYVNIGCTTPYTFYGKFIFAFALIPVILADVLGIYAVRKSVEGIANHCAKMFLMAVFLVYPFVTQSMFQGFSCHRLSETEQYLEADYRIDCLSSGYTDVFTPVGKVGIVLFPLGIPIVTLFLLLKNTKEISAGGPMRERYLFLVNDYKPGFHFWDTLEMLRKAILTGLLIFFRKGSLLQLVVAITISIGFTSATAWFQPYQDVMPNCFKMGTEIALLFTLVFIVLLKIDLTNEDITTDFVGQVMLAINVVIPGLSFVAGVFGFGWGEGHQPTDGGGSCDKGQSFENPLDEDGAETE